MASKDYEQGEDYEEYEDDEDAEEYDEDGDVETVYDTFYGIPKKVVYLGVAVVIVIVIAIFVFVTWGGDKESEEEAPVAEDTPVAADGADDFDSMWGGDTFTDTPVVEEQPVTENTYQYDIEDLTPFDVKELRSYGYTGDEIEFAISHGFSIEAMIERSKAELDAANVESWKRTSDAASDEYKHLMNMTYLGQPEGDAVVNQDELEFLDRVMMSSYVTINCDYVKCPQNGMQLYLKCKVANDTYYWYPVSPDRWVTLPDSGNIVLQITFMQYGEGTFITDAVETDSTLDTIDSSNDIDDVTDGTATEEAVDEATSSDGVFLTE